MKGLLLAGGHGTRLRPLTFTGNKHLLPVANKPMILYGLEHLIRADVKEVGVVLGPLKEGVVELLGDGSKFGIHLTYIEQPEPKGLAHAVLMAEGFLGDSPFIMYLGDNLLKQGAKPLVETFDKNGCDCVIGVTKVKDPSRYGVVQFGAQNKILRLVEKPREHISDWALIGVYVFNRKIIDVIKRLKPSARGELEITDAIQLLLNQGEAVDVQFVQGWWKDTGRSEDLLEANQLVLRDLQPYNHGVVESNASVDGPVAIGSGTVVRSGSKLSGPAIIGDGCTIGPGADIGPYTSVGDRTVIRNSEVENSILMNGTTIDCHKRIIDSIIGRGVKIVSSDDVVPRGYKFILGDATYVSM